MHFVWFFTAKAQRAQSRAEVLSKFICGNLRNLPKCGTGPGKLKHTVLSFSPAEIAKAQKIILVE
jgi:hypothetical protein